eukprot:scaffold3046_cov124-Pinguiococcus_pyrenoidosus.AAC.2
MVLAGLPLSWMIKLIERFDLLLQRRRARDNERRETPRRGSRIATMTAMCSEGRQYARFRLEAAEGGFTLEIGSGRFCFSNVFAATGGSSEDRWFCPRLEDSPIH